MRRCFASLAAAVALAIGQPSHAEEPECYDLKIKAVALAQVPTEIVEDPDYIVMSWPWFVDLEVKQVLDGEFEGRKLTALAVLHTRFISKTRVFLIRYNSLGGFNILRPENPESLRRCDPATGPMPSYLTPGEGQTLEDYRKAGEKAWESYLNEGLN